VPARIPVHRTLPRVAAGAAVLAFGVAGLTACGGSTSGSASAASSTAPASTSSSAAASSPAGGTAQAEAITATEKDFSISLSEDSLKAGTYAITVVNNGSATHDLAVEEDGAMKATSAKIGPGQSTTLTVDLDAGQYTFYCSIGNHRAMGMELTVQVS
jgi:plastocyanin